MKKTVVLLIGGFLGAGKTTLLARSAQYLLDQGKKVGLITNDQAGDMVDTYYLKRQGLNVREVTGSCFCCNFPALVQCMDSLREDDVDIILAESVGSCTDLSATIMQPLKDKLDTYYDIRPFSVVVEPLRMMEAFKELEFKDNSNLTLSVTPLHSSASYIVRKQMEEADILLVNKNDLISEKERKQLTAFLVERYPHVLCFSICATSGDSVDKWLKTVLNSSKAGMHLAAVDYDTYAEGEAVLGWLNAAVSVHTQEKQSNWQKFCQAFMSYVQTRFDQEHASIGHFKFILTTPVASIKSHLIHCAPASDIDGLIPPSELNANLIINARVEMSPELLEKIIRDALQEICEQQHISSDIHTLKSFRPGRPNPTMRYKNIYSK